MPTLQTYGPPAGPVAPRPGGPPPLPLISPLVRQSLGYDKAAQTHDGLGWLVLTLAFCVLSVGWTGYFMPQSAPIELGGGGDPAEPGAEDSILMDAPPEAEPESTETDPVQESEQVLPVEEIPEPVAVEEAPDMVTVPAPPEIVKPLQVIDPKPERPKMVTQPTTPKPRAATRSTKPAGTSGTVSTGPSITNGAGGGGSGSGQGPGKNQKNRTPRPPYPFWAKSAKIAGTVLMRLVIDSTGRIVSASVVQSCGNSRLDNETVNFIRSRWFLPASAGSTQPLTWTYRLK
ncbi:MAG: energy transducer TonB [Verrucomicrobiaceae bacterium]|nr:MAG: energy transducer TonB [Verrucomicrobiaceae bacterium]